jgi:hypothetical protein
MRRKLEDLAEHGSHGARRVRLAERRCVAPDE